MKSKYLIISFLSLFSVLSYAQKITINRDSICSILSKAHGCQVTITEASTAFNPSIRTWGSFPNLSIEGTCISLCYDVEKDNAGTPYKRILYIPIDLLGKTVYSTDDYVYIEDHCNGKGIHFDTQGGRCKANNTIYRISKYISYFK